MEIQERRPRTWNEPRRQRISFVKDRKRASDDWMLTGASRKLSQVEQWNSQRDASLRHWRHQDEQQRLLMQYQQQQLLHPYPIEPRIAPIMQPLPPQDQDGPPRLEPRRHDHDDNIIAVEEGYDPHHGHDDYHDGHHPNNQEPMLIEPKPRFPVPKEFKTKKSKSKGHREQRHRPQIYSDDSSSSDNYVAYRGGKRGSGSRRSSRRPRNRSRHYGWESGDSWDGSRHVPLRGKSRTGG
ncbi:hypothetical protein MMC28_010381 [Mycoblastus sanguinarius]|nr:hypothetical protein [Mycoblastus sanguinarius]